MPEHNVTIRLFANHDANSLAELHAINQASTPGVSSETLDDFRHILSLGECYIAEQDGRVLGFINLIQPGTLAYTSLNLRWLEDWGQRTGRCQIYVDRIALHSDARGQGIGARLYADVKHRFPQVDAITAEVNTMPDNPGSHRFHQRLGFERIGEQVFVPGEKAVAYYALTVKPA